MSIKTISYIIFSVTLLTIISSFLILSLLFTSYKKGQLIDNTLRKTKKTVENSIATLREYLVFPTERTKIQLLLVTEHGDNYKKTHGNTIELKKFKSSYPLIKQFIKKHNDFHKNLNILCKNIEKKDENIDSISNRKLIIKEIGLQLFLFSKEMSGYLHEISLLAKKDLDSKRNLFFGTIFASVLILSLLLILIVFWINKGLIVPLLRLQSSATNISKGDFETQTFIKSNNEIGSLADSFNIMQKSIKKNIADLKKAQSLAHVGNWEWTLGNDEFILSDEMYNIYGIEKGTEYSNIHELIEQATHPDDIIYIKEHTQKAAETGKGEKLTYRIIRANGEERWIEAMPPDVNSSASDGTPLSLIGTIQDITERKNAEDELRYLQNYLSNIINSMPSILIGVNTEGIITQWNMEAERTTGLSTKDAIGQPLVKAVPRLSDEMDKIHAAIKTRKEQFDPKRAVHTGNEIHYEDITIYPLVANGVEGAVIRIDDITEKVRIEEMMVQSEKMLSVGGLAAGMAHEINNPLAGMMQNADVLKNRLTDLTMPANLKVSEKIGISMEMINEFMERRDIIKMLNRIKESGIRAAEIVSNMLNFARKSDSSFSSCDMAELLDKTADLAGSDYDLKKKFDFRQIEIVHEYEKDLPLVICESGKIQQVLLNVLRNGAEAMQNVSTESSTDNLNLTTEKPKFIIRLNHEKDKQRIHIEIEDNGPGMNIKTRKRVFEPFFTTKPTDRGTGLGLSVSYFIITENHKGTMSVESELGKGSKFIITLPV